MKKRKYIALTLILSLLCMNKTYAACTDEEIKEFKQVKNEYKITTEFDINTKKYNITLLNPKPDKYGYRLDSIIKDIKYLTSTDNSVTFSNLPPGTYTIGVVGLSESCSDSLKDIVLELPAYNVYYEDPLCEGIEEFVLCQPTYKKEIDRATFESRVNTYKKTKLEQEKENVQEENQEPTIIDVINNNLGTIIVVTSFIVLLVITTIVTIKTARKSRRLE